MSNSLGPHGLYSPRNSPGQNTGVGSHSLLQGFFPTQGSNPDFPHCKQILYQQSHKGSPRTLEWVAYSFSRGSSLPKESNQGLLHYRQFLYQLSYQGSLISGYRQGDGTKRFLWSPITRGCYPPTLLNSWGDKHP